MGKNKLTPAQGVELTPVCGTLDSDRWTTCYYAILGANLYIYSITY